MAEARSTDSFPPRGYVADESAVPGIEVFKPAPPGDRLREVVEFRCPQCDGVTGFSAAEGGVTCAFCGYHEAPQQEVVGRGAEQFEFTVETMNRAVRGWGQARKELQCQQCGARTTLPEETLTHTCPFCGSNQVVQLRAPQDVLRPRFLVPFSVDADDALTKAAAWLGRSWMVPSRLQRLIHEAEFSPVYIPFWTFDARVKADWHAEVGHERTRRDAQGRTHTTTEWRWESGQVRIFFDDLLVSGSNKLSPSLLVRVRPFDLEALVPYLPDYLAGMEAQAYDVDLETAWDQGRKRMRDQTKALCYTKTSTRRVRNFSVQLAFSDESWRYLLLPIYLASYQHGNRTFQVLVNGQTGDVAGQRPVDWRKVGLVAAVILAPGLLLLLLAAVLAAVGAAPVALSSLMNYVGTVLFVVAIIIVAAILGRARSLDDD